MFVPPCGAGFLVERRMFLSARTERNQRCAKGTPSMSAFARRALIGGLPRTPFYDGTHSCFLGRVRPAGKIRTGWFFLPRGHGPLLGAKFKSVCVVRTPPTLAELWQLGSCWGRWNDTRRTQQVGRHQAVCVRRRKQSNFDGRKALWPGSRTETNLDFARRNELPSQSDPLP